MKLNFKGRVAIVTGSSDGIGFAIAKNLSSLGVKVLLVSRNIKKLKKARERIVKEGGIAEYIKADVSITNTPKKVLKKCINIWGKVDILINNTGGPDTGGILKLNDKQWNYAIQNNLLSVIRFSKLVLPIMKKNNWGRIITIGSTIVKEPSPNMILSATSRGGIQSFTKSIAVEFAKNNISANVISPGAILTERFRNLVKIAAKRENKSYKKKINEIKRIIPANRIASADEISNAVIFLASESGSYINGINLSFDGAFTKGY